MNHLTRFFVISLLALMAIDAMAWGNSRDQKWEAMFDLHYQSGEKIEGRNDSFVDFKQDIGWGFGFGYNLNRHFNIGLNFNFTDTSYTAEFYTEDQNNLGTTEKQTIRHKADHYSFHLDATYHIFAGDVTPLLQLGIGSAEIDSNISNGPGYTACWYDPWYGYICDSYYDSYSASGMSLRAGAGIRADFANGAFFKAIYTRQFIDLDLASGDLELDQLALQLGSKF